MRQAIGDEIRQSGLVVAAMGHDEDRISTVEAIAGGCATALIAGNWLLFIGNGGSAADLQHLAGGLISRFAYDRPGLTAIALTTDTSVITAIGNDYDRPFATQVETIGRVGDVLFGISTSGRSRNILAVLEVARATGLVTVAITGNPLPNIVECANDCIEIPSAISQKIREGHIVVAHIICGLIKNRIFPQSQ